MIITLFLEDGGWMARHEGPGSEEITSLFDTDTLPTPFLEGTDADSVRRVIEQLNPDAEVRVA